MTDRMTAAEFNARYVVGRDGRAHPKSSEPANAAYPPAKAKVPKDAGVAASQAPAGGRPAPNLDDGSEDALQMAVIARLRPLVEAEGGLLIATESKNSGLRGKRGMIHGYRRKMMGVRAGFPDLVAFDENQKAGFLELKTAKGRLSPEQCEFRDLCQRVGWRWAVVRSVHEATCVLREWDMIA